MTAAITRDLKITYGGTTVGGDSDYQLDGIFELTEDYEQFELAADVTIISAPGDDEETFADKVKALESAFRTPDQKLEVINNSETWFVADPSDNSGFNQRARCEKQGDPDGPDSGRSRKYRITVRGGMPADLSGRGGRRSSRVRIQHTGSRKKIVTISGTYTALSASSALQRYNSSIEAYVSAVLTSLGGTYNLSREEAEHDDQNKVLDFSRVYTEILVNEAIGALDHAAIVDQVLTVSYQEIGGRDSPADFSILSDVGSPHFRGGKAVRPVRVQIDAAMKVDRNEVTPSGLTGLWTGTVLPWLIQHAVAISGGTFAAVEEVTRSPTTTENILAGRVVAIVLLSPLLSHTLTVKVSDHKGLVHLGVYGEEPLWKHLLQDERTVFRVITQTFVLSQGAALAGAGGGGGAGQGAGPATSIEGALFQAIGEAQAGAGSNWVAGGGSSPGDAGQSFGVAGGGVPEGAPYNAAAMTQLGITPPDVDNDAKWDTLDTDQDATPTRWGVEGREFDARRLVVTTVQALRVEPPGQGTGTGKTAAR